MKGPLALQILPIYLNDHLAGSVAARVAFGA